MKDVWVVWLYDNGENNYYGPFDTERAAHVFLNESFMNDFDEKTDVAKVIELLPIPPYHGASP